MKTVISYLSSRTQDVRVINQKSMQTELPKVCWGKKEVENFSLFVYFGSVFETDSDQMCDVKTRISKVSTTFRKLRHIWSDSVCVVYISI